MKRAAGLVWMSCTVALQGKVLALPGLIFEYMLTKVIVIIYTYCWLHNIPQVFLSIEIIALFLEQQYSVWWSTDWCWSMSHRMQSPAAPPQPRLGGIIQELNMVP